MSSIKSTYKHSDVEETMDIYFTRPLGYLCALAARHFNLTPNAITLMSMALGILGGHFFFYTDTVLNLIGIFLFTLGNILDSADGQLARLTDSHTTLGRILDGFSDSMKFFSVYLHICLRYVDQGGSAWIFAVALLAGYCHSFQAAVADYYRTGYLYFVNETKSSGFDDSTALSLEYNKLQWRSNFVKKIFLRLYLNYTLQQEFAAKRFRKLAGRARALFGEENPMWLRHLYKSENRRMIKYYNLLTLNLRMIVLFFFVLLKKPVYFFLLDLTLLNALLLFVIIRQNAISGDILSKIESTRAGRR